MVCRQLRCVATCTDVLFRSSHAHPQELKKKDELSCTNFCYKFSKQKPSRTLLFVSVPQWSVVLVSKKKKSCQEKQKKERDIAPTIALYSLLSYFFTFSRSIFTFLDFVQIFNHFELILFLEVRPKTMAAQKNFGKKKMKIIKNCNAEPCRLLDRAGWLKWLKQGAPCAQALLGPIHVGIHF